MASTFYFSHDYTARSDQKIKRLINHLGFQGYGIYWAIIEDLYLNANALPMDCEGMAVEYRTTPTVIEKLVNDFDLFKVKGKIFSSPSVAKRLEIRNEKSINARKSAELRWKDRNATAMRTHTDGNAIKESKIKESKIKERGIYIQGPTDFETLVNQSESNKKNQQPDIERFSPPTVESVALYFESLKAPASEAEMFCNFYQAKGWMVGKNKMKDWKAAARGWVLRSVSDKNTAAVSASGRRPAQVSKLESIGSEAEKSLHIQNFR